MSVGNNIQSMGTSMKAKRHKDFIHTEDSYQTNKCSIKLSIESRSSFIISSRLLNKDDIYEILPEPKKKTSLDCADIALKSKLSSEMDINSNFGLKAKRWESRTKTSQTDKIPIKKSKKEFIEDFILEEEDENDNAYFDLPKVTNYSQLKKLKTEKLRNDPRNRSFSSIIGQLHLQFGNCQDQN